MTNILFDLVDVVGEVRPGDTVRIWPPRVTRNADGQVQVTRPETINVGEGPVTRDISPGPLWVQIQAGGYTDTDPKLVRVPEEGESPDTVTIANLLARVEHYDPVLESWAYENAGRAEQAALEAIAARDRSESGAELSKDSASVAVAAAVGIEANIESMRWVKRPLAAAADIDALVPGVYPVPNANTASGLGLPESVTGQIVHFDLDGSRFHRRQYFQAEPLDSPATVYRRTCYLGNWRPWVAQDSGGDGSSHYRGSVPEGLTPEEMTGSEYQGLWTYSSAQAISWSVPSRAAGFLTVLATRTSTMHEVSTLTTPIQNYQRRWYNGNWSGDWERIGGGSTPAPAPEPVEADEYANATSKAALNALVPGSVDPTLSYEVDHAALVAELKSRLGTVSTGGKAAVALVADHGTTAFKEWMWDALKARGIPCTMALAPEIHLDGKGDSRHTASNDDIKQWISEGLVIASHSGDHSGALGYFDVSRQIVTSKKKLEEKLETQVDCWVQPGYTLATGNYDGFGTGQSASRYTDYYAGRMLQQTYAVVTGYAGNDFVYPGDADLPVGVRRSLTERKDNQAGVIANIEQAIATGGKHINFCHPYALPESSSTYITRDEYIDYLDWLVDKRDAGALVLLTLPELAVSSLD